MSRNYPTIRRWLAWRWRRYGFSVGRLLILPDRICWLGPLHTYTMWWPRYAKYDRDNL